MDKIAIIYLMLFTHIWAIWMFIFPYYALQRIKFCPCVCGPSASLIFRFQSSPHCQPFFSLPFEIRGTFRSPSSSSSSSSRMQRGDLLAPHKVQREATGIFGFSRAPFPHSLPLGYPLHATRNFVSSRTLLWEQRLRGGMRAQNRNHESQLFLAKVNTNGKSMPPYYGKT